MSAVTVLKYGTNQQISGLVSTTDSARFATLGIGVAAPISGSIAITQSASTSGTPQSALIVSPGSHTTLTASEVIDIDLAVNRTVQFTAGSSIPTQRSVLIRAPTYSATAAQIIENSGSLVVSGPPIAGLNITITETKSLWVQSGLSRFDGALNAGNSSEFSINSTGNITRINNVSTNWPAVQGTASTVLTNDGTGNLSWAASGASASGWTDDGAVVRLTTAGDRVGIGTATPDTKIDIDGDISFRVVTPAVLTAGNNNDYAGADGRSFARLSANASGSTITGFANGKNGRMIIIVNLSNSNLVIAHNNSSSLIANRIINSSGMNLTMTRNDAMTLIYDSITQRWRQIAVLGIPSTFKEHDD
jgi:hypothetical protein